MKECPKCTQADCMDIRQLNDKVSELEKEFEELYDITFNFGRHLEKLSETQLRHQSLINAMMMKMDELTD